MDTIKVWNSEGGGWTYHERADRVFLRTAGALRRKKPGHQKKRVYGFKSILGFCYRGDFPNIVTSKGNITFGPQEGYSEICDIYVTFTGRV